MTVKIIPLPEVEVQYFPSNPRGHVVVRDTILEAWKEVLYLLTRFGRRVTLKKGDRLELQHVKVVVEKPAILKQAEFDNSEQSILIPRSCGATRRTFFEGETAPG